MTRLFCVGIVVAAVLFAVPAFASVPFPGNCIIQWFQAVPGAGDTLIIVCPAGDRTALDVTVRDQFNLPIPGQIVTAAFADARVCAQPITGVTDVNGYVRLTIRAGANSSAVTKRVGSSYTVQCMGYTLATKTTSIMSPDYNCNPTVDALDFSFFALDWPPAAYAPRSDFNNDGFVDALDFSLFALDWLDS